MRYMQKQKHWSKWKLETISIIRLYSWTSFTRSCTSVFLIPFLFERKKRHFRILFLGIRLKIFNSIFNVQTANKGKNVERWNFLLLADEWEWKSGKATPIAWEQKTQSVVISSREYKCVCFCECRLGFAHFFLPFLLVFCMIVSYFWIIMVGWIKEEKYGYQNASIPKSMHFCAFDFGKCDFNIVTTYRLMCPTNLLYRLMFHMELFFPLAHVSHIIQIVCDIGVVTKQNTRNFKARIGLSVNSWNSRIYIL